MQQLQLQTTNPKKYFAFVNGRIKIILPNLSNPFLKYKKILLGPHFLRFLCESERGCMIFPFSLPDFFSFSSWRS